MKAYATINEVKRNLPEILQRIEDLKIFDDCALSMLRTIEEWCVDETIFPDHDHGWWTYEENYKETFKNHMQYQAEIKYLQGLIAKLPSYKDQIT